MTDSAMILHESNGSAMSAYQDRDDVRELGDRLLAMHPAAAEVGPAAMRAAAQLSLMLGANPLPGPNEVHIWKDNKGRACMSLGIGYWRRKGYEWGGYLYEVRPRPMKPAELTEYGIPGGTLAAICKGCRAADMIRYKQLGFTTAEVWDMCGRTGVGTQGSNEFPKSGRPSIWTSLKRAESDMLRQLFPAEFAGVTYQIASPAAPIVTVETTEDEVTEEVEEGRYNLDDANADFGLGPATPPANGKPAAPPVVVDNETLPDPAAAAIRTSPRDEFVSIVARYLEVTEGAVKERIRALGYTAISGKWEDRVRLYGAIRAYTPPAAQPELFSAADEEQRRAALATAQDAD